MIAANYGIFGRRYGNAILAAKFTAYYKFDSNLTDAVGGMNGTGNNIDYVGGKIGNAVRFDSAADYVDVADNDAFSFTTGGGNDVAFTICGWFYFTGFSTTGNWMVNKRNSIAGGDEWQLIYLGGKITITKHTSDVDYQGVQSAASLISLNTWYHISITDNGSKTNAGMKMYLNGAELTTTTLNVGTYAGMPNGISPVRFGHSGWNLASALRHQGYIDELGFCKGSVLSGSEITKIYNSGTGKTYPF